jgi:hypothetical protein
MIRLRSSSDDDDHRPPRRSACVDIFPEADKLNLYLIEFVQDLEHLAYNLGNICRWLAQPGEIEDWSLTSVQQRLVKTVDDSSSMLDTTVSCWRKDT